MRPDRCAINLRRFLFAFFMVFVCSPLFALEVPALSARVNDYAGMLSPAAASTLEARLRDLETTDSTQIVILTVPSLEGDSLESFSIRVAEKWKIGQKKLDNGVILLAARDDRKVRIEVGYGLEGSLTDLISGRIIQDVITPRFREGNYDEGFVQGVDAVIAVVRGEFTSRGLPTGQSLQQQGGRYGYPLLFLLIFIGIVGSIKRLLGGIVGAVLFPIAGVFFLPLGLWLLLLIPLGFIAGLILPTLFMLFGMSGGRHFGGGFGGGFSSGGFGGGGGGFGGGGASGSW